MRILLIFGRYFKNLGGFSKILGVSSGILEDSWRILRSSRSVFKDYIIVKFVLKLFQTYITSDYFLYLCNGLTSIAIPEANDQPTGVSVEYGL